MSKCICDKMNVKGFVPKLITHYEKCFAYAGHRELNNHLLLNYIITTLAIFETQMKTTFPCNLVVKGWSQ